MLFLNGILMFLEAAVGLVVNSVMVVILRKSETWRSLTNIFLLNLVLSHVILTLGLLCLGSPIFYFNPHIYDFLLKAGPFCLCSGFFSSTLLLMMMSFHRYLLVLHPLSDPGSHDGRHGITVSIITWTVSISAAVPIQRQYYNFCWWFSIRINILYFFFLCVAIFCFVRIFQTLSNTSGERKDRTVRVILSMVVLHCVLWTPFCVMVILNLAMAVYVRHDDILAELIYFAVTSLHCCINPILYMSLREKVTSHTGSQSSTNLPVSTENETFLD